MPEPDLYEIPTRVPGQQVNIPSLTRMHHGQHGDECFACKISTLHFGQGENLTHVVKGNPWVNNPVVDRIQELSGGTIEINTDVPRPPGAV